ncbi:hypothetical protein BDV23DRAFT_177301 [Aspergillus alliaceus]|uniref:Uncharacterized protein n=1 Tax=Petromyces alliaceus TaxID=209559 RepID=A0A5N7BQP2_PETAA|nr:hypothetical protein BDV23DRAFT_177301 [Aspergillus alliaceus]
MELLRLARTNDLSADVKGMLAQALGGLTELRQLDIITEILTGATVVDDKVAEMVYTAWEYLCHSNLWCYRYESLGEYRRLICYQDIIRPIIQRFKKSDRAKVSSMETIQYQWGLPVAQVLPQHITPKSWSKHLLFLLATLSKHKTRQDAIALLEKSISQRPARSRHTYMLMPSDVRRALEVSSIYTRYTASSSKYELTAQETHGTSPDRHSHIIINSLSTNTSEQSITDTEESCYHSFNSSSFPGQADNLYDCKCSPICFPLKVLLNGQTFHKTDRVILELFQWAKSVSWPALCLVHLQRLAAFKFGDQTMSWSRDEAIHYLEDLLLEASIPEADIPLLTEPSDPQQGYY